MEETRGSLEVKREFFSFLRWYMLKHVYRLMGIKSNLKKEENEGERIIERVR